MTVRALGFDTVAYRSAEALQRFDRILIDQNLPGLAASTCRIVAMSARGVGTPLILMRGRDEPQLRQQCKESGIPLLIKPLVAATLEHTISAAIEARPVKPRKDRLLFRLPLLR
jgi:DNA-binding response OmpR family regulator